MGHRKIIHGNNTILATRALEDYNEISCINFLRVDTFGNGRGAVGKDQISKKKELQKRRKLYENLIIVE